MALQGTDQGLARFHERFRELWATACNSVAAETGARLRVDHRSVARQIADATGTRPQRRTPHERVRSILAARERVDSGILRHASARLEAAEAAGRITAVERFEKQWRLQEHLRAKTLEARLRLQAAASKRSS